MKDIQSIDYSWVEIKIEVTPMNQLMTSCDLWCLCDSSYDLDIEPYDIEVTYTVTVVWEIV